MKKNFKSFIIIWAVGLVLFNLCAFLIPTETRFTPNFWSAYGFVTVAFVLQLGVSYFTSKEEKRRLQCAVYLSSTLPDYTHISTQNKINFIGCSHKSLSEDMVYGLYVLFNSTVYDQYYRILNGSTQVNSTEMNQIPVPPIEEIERMGRMLRLETDWESVNVCDKIINSSILNAS